MLQKGASNKRFEDSYDSALSFNRQIVEDELLGIYLLIQQEMVDDKKIIPEIQAGKELLLRYTLKEVLEMQKTMAELERAMAEGRGDGAAQRREHKEARQRIMMDSLVLQIQQLKIPFLRKLKRFLGIRVPAPDIKGATWVRLPRGTQPGLWPTERIASSLGAPNRQISMPRPNIFGKQGGESRQEIIIPIMGATGAGKSTFFNYLVQDEKQQTKVGHKLTSCTSKLHPAPLTFPNDPFLQQYTVTLVDTPGFDDTYIDDTAILQRIADWLKNKCRDKKVLGGVIYLHDISSDRFCATARRNLEMFNRMCRDAALEKVIIGTTKWGRVPPDIGAKHEDELKKVHWRSMLEKGAQTMQFEDSYDSALSFIKQIVRGGSRQEIIIPVMGATGVGKSTFVNYLAQDERQKSKVGHGSTSCTSELHHIALTFLNDPFLQQYKITLVDTPGFDDTYVGDAAILQRIADSLETAYREKKVLGGVIYLHDISSDRFSGTARRNLEMFNHMCGNAALKKVIIGTTKWGRTPLDIGAKHEDELKQVHWRPMMEQGAKTKRFEDSYDSALSFISQMVRDEMLEICLMIQQEIVDDKKIIPETQAGTKLRYTLQEVLDMQRKMLELEKVIAEGGGDDATQKAHEEARQRMDALMLQIQQLKVPFLRKLKKFF
ncbi:hypothetical protein CPC08DRAFT_821053 [Agrocybe pediades]|nr:hypothetical protein CPC08DRAFT_821053 [Agrocybe pediades]